MKRQFFVKLLAAAAHGASAEPHYKGSATDVFTLAPEQFLKFRISESERWGRVIKAAGIEPG